MDNYRLNMALRRTFPIRERLQFIFGVDGSNLTNHTTFGNNAGNNQINVNVNSSGSFGTLNFATADPRDFQTVGTSSVLELGSNPNNALDGYNPQAFPTNHSFEEFCGWLTQVDETQGYWPADHGDALQAMVGFMKADHMSSAEYPDPA